MMMLHVCPQSFRFLVNFVWSFLIFMWLNVVEGLLIILIKFASFSIFVSAETLATYFQA